MPPSKPKPSEIASEAKKTYIPYIKQKFPQWSTESYLFVDPESQCRDKPNPGHRCRVAFIEGDPVDVALSWATDSDIEGEIPVISMANDKRPGGDWEASVVAPEENLCRRSTLFATLNNGSTFDGSRKSHYPIPKSGGVYSKHVVVFRSGPDKYQVWKEFKALPIISVPPVKRPRLLEPAKQKYSFEDEKNLMKEKIRSALRIAYYYDHDNICLGGYGCGPVFRHPPREVATMFRDLLFFEKEFIGHFSNVVFAFDPIDSSSSSSSSSSKSSGTGSSSSSSGSSSSSKRKSDMDVFKEVLCPEQLYSTAYR